ncbi:hypothetical protein M3Y95_01055700 [Aphelenchoides besseyi]|nr:hypothetical protein M3Y95_01055700 [Aphelenchoides besseyi]
MAKSKYDEFFTVKPDEDDVIYECPQADCNFSYSRKNGKTPVPLRNHLKESHPEDYQRLEAKEKAGKENVQPKATAVEMNKTMMEPLVEQSDSATAVRVKADLNSTIMQPPITQQPIFQPPIVHQPLIQQPVAMQTPQFSPTSSYNTSSYTTPRQPLPMSTEQTRSSKRFKPSSSMPSTSSTNNCASTSCSTELNAFGQYVGQRLNALPTPKRRKLELQMMMILNEAEAGGSNMLVPNNQEFY